MRNLPIASQLIFRSNLFLVICCVFYWIWWLLAFKPEGAVKGMKTGWLLIPTFAAGIAAIVLAVRGMQSSDIHNALFPSGSLLWGGIAAYLILLAITVLFLKRPATTELILIVGWAALELAEIDALYGSASFSRGCAAALAVVVGAAALISLVCYVLYYKLENRAGYVDGMVPLILIALVAAGVSAAIVI